MSSLQPSPPPLHPLVDSISKTHSSFFQIQHIIIVCITSLVLTTSARTIPSNSLYLCRNQFSVCKCVHKQTTITIDTVTKKFDEYVCGQKAEHASLLPKGFACTQLKVKKKDIFEHRDITIMAGCELRCTDKSCGNPVSPINTPS